MDEELYVDGLGIAAGVVETIVALATEEVSGVAGVGSHSALSGIKSLSPSRKQAPSGGITVEVAEGALKIGVRVQVFYGCRLTDVAAGIRSTIADAVVSQVGVSVSAVDVFIDGVQFGE